MVLPCNKIDCVNDRVHSHHHALRNAYPFAVKVSVLVLLGLLSLLTDFSPWIEKKIKKKRFRALRVKPLMRVIPLYLFRLGRMARRGDCAKNLPEKISIHPVTFFRRIVGIDIVATRTFSP